MKAIHERPRNQQDEEIRQDASDAEGFGQDQQIHTLGAGWWERSSRYGGTFEKEGEEEADSPADRPTDQRPHDDGEDLAQENALVQEEDAASCETQHDDVEREKDELNLRRKKSSVNVCIRGSQLPFSLRMGRHTSLNVSEGGIGMPAGDIFK